MEKPLKENLPVNHIITIANQALLTANKNHLALGPKGFKRIRTNRFGNEVLVADWKAEEEVIATLKDNHLPIIVVSEEHGTMLLQDKPRYFAVLDGLDGTNVYESTKGQGRYGTMLGIFAGTNPFYADYLYSGIMIHSTGELFYAAKESGSWVMINNQQKSLRCSRTTAIDHQIRLLANSYPDPEHGSDDVLPFIKKLSRFNPICMNSTAVHFVDLVAGKVDAVLEYTRKGNLEIATAYGLIKEAGGVMMTLDGEDLGGKKYKEFAQKEDEHIIVVSTGTSELNDELRKIITS